MDDHAMQPAASSLSPEDIDANWQKFSSLLKKTGDRAASIAAMLKDVEERLVLCPASARVDFHNAFPGGLVDHSLRVLYNAMRLVKAFDWKVSNESLIIACLFHDLGKLGDDKQDYYVFQTDEWRSKHRGEEYAYNKELRYMSVPHRSIWLLQHYGVKLSQDEMLAILLNDGQYAKENASYALKEPMLADIVHMADVISTKQEKDLLP